MAEGTTHHFLVAEGSAGTRLDRLIPLLLPDLSRNRVQQLIAAGNATVDGASASKHHLVHAGERLEVTLPPPEPALPRAEAIPLEILHEDKDLVAVNKPAGMVVHPAPGHAGGTLVNALLGAVKNLSGIGGELRPGIVHRLDKGTSGVVLVAKNDRTHRALAAQFAGRAVEKTYVSLAWGVMDEDEGVFEAAMGRDVKDRKKISIRSRRARPAVTRWKVLRRLPDATLLELHPETGRTHQIRVHLATALHPVLGDPDYGPGGPRGKAFHKASVRHGFAGRLALHAWRIAFAHPTGKTRMEIVAPLPPELASLLPDRPTKTPAGRSVRTPKAASSPACRRGGAEGRTPACTPPRRAGAEVRSGRTPKAARSTDGKSR